MKYLRIAASGLPGSVTPQYGLKELEKLVVTGALLALLLILTIPNPVHAAPIGLVAVPGSPNVDTSQAKLVYDWDDTDADPNNHFGTLTIDGKFTGGPDGKVIQSMIIPNTTNWGGTGQTGNLIDAASGTSLLTRYLLKAFFDKDGNFVTTNPNDGSQVSRVEIDGILDIDPSTAGIQEAPLLDPTVQFLPGDGSPSGCYLTCGTGNFLRANLTGFGWRGNSTSASGPDDVTFEWFMQPQSGDLFNAGHNNTTNQLDVGVIAAGLMNYGVTGTYGDFGVLNDWDPLNDNTPDVFKGNDFFSQGTLNVDTFVPVPAALWLFGSGLMGLIGVGAQNRRRRLAA